MSTENIDPRDEVLSKKEAAAFLRVSLRLFEGLAVPPVRLDTRHPRYLRSTLLRFAKDREHAA